MPEKEPETITSNTEEQETIEDIENFITGNKPTEENTHKEAEITTGAEAKGKFYTKDQLCRNNY